MQEKLREKGEMKAAALEMGAQTERMVTVHKNTVVDVEMIAKGDVDEVILCSRIFPQSRFSWRDRISLPMYLHRKY